jgi:sulfatase maturation enzyme AslB (radical SAM superfamily)
MADTFCVMPWYGFEIRKQDSNCCWLTPDHNIDEVKKDLLNGIQSKWCSKCWKAEKNGNVSRRLQQNLLLDVLLDKSIETLENDVRETKNKTFLYSISTSDKCNGACVTCGPEDSSKWNLLLKTNKKPDVLDNIDDFVDYQNAKFIEFLGGEPLLENKNLQILEKLLDAGNNNCLISIVTNGNVSLMSKHLDLLSQFKKVVVCLSIDGIGPVFEYLRWPLKWNLLLKNLELFRSMNFDLSVSYTLSNINLPFKEETIKWFETEKLPYLINNVVCPWYFSPEVPIDNKITQETLDAQDKLKGISRSDFLNYKTS